MSLFINSVISKFCSLLVYSEFGPLIKFLYSALNVRNDPLFYFLSLIMIISLTDFNVLENSGCGTKDTKSTDHCILDR